MPSSYEYGVIVSDTNIPDLKDGVFVGIRNAFNEKQIVMVRHKYGAKKWSLPGGGIRFGEVVPHAAIREALEETRLHVKSLRQVGTFTLRKKYGLVVLFEALEWDGIPLVGEDNPEISDIAFKSIGEIPDEEIYPAQRSLMMILEQHRVNTHQALGWDKQLYGYLTVPPTLITI